MDFSEALAAVKAGQKVQRPHMHDEHVRVYTQAHRSAQEEAAGIPMPVMTEPVCLKSWVFNAGTAAAPDLRLHTVDGREIPWHPEPADLVADDWRTALT